MSDVEEQQETIQDFANESLELLEEVEASLVGLSDLQGDDSIKEEIDTIFRFFHTLKGGAGFLNFKNIQNYTHELETLFQVFRVEPQKWSIDLIEILHEACDFIKDMLESIKATFSDEEFFDSKEEAIKKLQLVTSHLTLSQSEESGGSDESVKKTISNADELIKKISDALLVLKNLHDEVDHNDYLPKILDELSTLKEGSVVPNLNLVHNLVGRVEEFIVRSLSGGSSLQVVQIDLLMKIIDLIESEIKNVSEGVMTDPSQLQELNTLMEQHFSVPSKERQLIGDILIHMGVATPDDLDEALERQKKPIGEIMVEMGKISPEHLNKALEAQSSMPKKSSVITSSGDIRVKLEKLDTLIDLVGELLISEAMISQNLLSRDLGFEEVDSALETLSSNILSLQEIAMSMRMVPVSILFRKMHRVVHDVAKKQDKKVRLTLIGDDTELDKTISEQLSDPLLHIIRNAIDHGMESTEERIAIGKSSEGSLVLEAKYVGNEVWVIIKDDGRGLNTEKILQQAVQKGLLKEGGQLRDEEIYHLIFEPGFSTKDVVTELSGRGVGLDVVKKNLEKLRGKIDIQSIKGKGTTFTLKIPLTLSIIDGLLVKVGKTCFVIPILSVQETLRPDPEDIHSTSNKNDVLQIRDSTIPIFYLHSIHNIETDVLDPKNGMLLVINNEEKFFCLFVDSIIGEQPVVVKRLPKRMKNVPYLSGCTVMGDGNIALILDATSLANSLVWN